MLHSNNNSPILFTARCPQIRDAQWVCHTVNTTLPHFSTSKFAPYFKKYIENSSYLNYPKLTSKHLFFIANLLNNSILTIYDLKPLTFKEKTLKCFEFIFMPKKVKQQVIMLNKIRDVIYKVQQRRTELTLIENLYKKALIMLNNKIGNCYEDALSAELVLKINGINNAKTMALSQKDKILDHALCVFNKDGSNFDGKIKKGNTIIIDPWFGKADFAENMFIYYKNHAGKYIDMYKDSELSLKTLCENIPITSSELENFRKEYPQFIFHNKSRKFMSK